MNQEHYTTKKRKYTHLNLCERKEIERCFKAGFSIGAIAGALGRSKSTISREIKRGSVTQRKPKYSKPIKLSLFFCVRSEFVALFQTSLCLLSADDCFRHNIEGLRHCFLPI